MRSKFLSIALALLALTSGTMVFLHLTQKNLSALFGAPALSTNSRLFNFHPTDVRKITIASDGRPRNYEKQQGQWLIKTETTPDRADYRTLEALLAFSADLSILDSFPANKENLQAMGLAPAQANCHFKDSKGKTVTRFSLGMKGSWHRYIPAPDAYSNPQNLPSVYLRPHKSEFIYLCSSPYLDDILANGFDSLRDARPFFFPPELLAEVTIVRPNGKLVLARESPIAGWKIEKPFKLEADANAITELIGGVYKLTSFQTRNKPAPPATNPSLQLSLRFFSLNGTLRETPVTLSLSEPNNGNAGGENFYLGRLNDWRKDIEFELPRQSSNGLIGVDDLPLTIERLRGASLSGLDLKTLRKLTINSADLQGPLDIEISKSPISDEWRVQKIYQGQTTIANEFTFFNLKKTLTAEKAIGTISDSVEQLSEYGLENPSITLSLELFDGNTEQIHFGQTIGENGIPRFFFRRNESRTVMELDSTNYYKIAARPHLWRDARAWNFNIIDLNLLQIERVNNAPLTLDYSDLTQAWSARQGESDVTSLLNESRANRYLETLESLLVDRWLEADHEPARRALQNPVFTLTALFKRPDDEDSAIETKKLRLAGGNPGSHNQFYYGQVEGDPHYFILDLSTVTKLAEKLLEQE